MAMIYLGEHARLKKYGATTTGRKSVVRIEVEVGEPGALGFMLDELGRIEADQKHPPKRKPSRDEAEPPLALSPPLKQIPHFPGD
ncbi:hypothetical protein [Martelella radicis]|uniref:Uncharacterized protein n=1 Tax=Martelella radicis TaxID=1397476 RepID=A0A7W6KKS8_9HYPH|nr:hypothetical protein [Martelella radicis]MBB4122942.1 hypothetical protein [Martelella radicis]